MAKKLWTQKEWEHHIVINSKDAYSASVIWSVIALCCGWVSQIPDGHSGASYGAFRSIVPHVFHLYKGTRDDLLKMPPGFFDNIYKDIRKYCEDNSWNNIDEWLTK